MLDTVFRGLFDSDITTVIRVTDFLLCLGCALILGLIMAFAYMYRTRYTKSFVVTLALLPAVVCVVIMLVNGNVGTGVAVAGAFSLVRFRSVPGTAKEICTLFLAMGAGLIAGMGYLGFAVLFTVIMCAMFLLYNRLDFGAKKNAATYKTLAITIPEDLDYTGAFDDIFKEYTNGSLEISDGYITIVGPNQGDTATLDYDTSAVITGGTFIGSGASGMAQTFSSSEQGVISINMGSQAAGTTITITDTEGNTLATFSPELPFSIIIFSSPSVVSGETYTVTAGAVSGKTTAS